MKKKCLVYKSAYELTTLSHSLGFYPPAIDKLHPSRAEHDQKAPQHAHVPPQAGDPCGPWLYGRAG